MIAETKLYSNTYVQPVLCPTCGKRLFDLSTEYSVEVKDRGDIQVKCCRCRKTLEVTLHRQAFIQTSLFN